MPGTITVVAYQEAMARTRQAVARAATKLWSDLPTYDGPEIGGFVAQALPIIGAGQRQAVSLTQAYMSDRLGLPISDLDVDRLVGTYARNGADPAQVLRRPFVDTWQALEQGLDPSQASQVGLDSLTSSVETDVALSARDAAAASISGDPRVVGWERVPDDGACDFCLMASTQRYSTGDLMDLHNRCGCSVDPILADEPKADMGQVINPDLLDQLKDVSTSTYDHGELGPVLGAGGDHATDSADVIGKSSTDWADWARSQNWEVTTVTDQRIEGALASGQTIAWERSGSAWRVTT